MQTGSYLFTTPALWGETVERFTDLIFNEAYRLKRRWTGLEESEDSHIWLVPGVRIIWFDLHLTAPMMNPREVLRSWELLSYDFSP